MSSEVNVRMPRRAALSRLGALPALDAAIERKAAHNDVRPATEQRL